MEINFGKIELENLINVVANVKRTDCGQECQWVNINAETVVCGDKEVNEVSFHVQYNLNDRFIELDAGEHCWGILWDNNDISFDDIKKLFTEKIAVVDKDEDGFYVFENLDEIIELDKMYKKYVRKHDISYCEYIEYVKNYINK